MDPVQLTVRAPAEGWHLGSLSRPRAGIRPSVVPKVQVFHRCLVLASPRIVGLLVSMPQQLHRRMDTVHNPRTRREETWITLMVQTPSGRFHAIWAGRDESGFLGSAAGKAWAAGEKLPMKVAGRDSEVVRKAIEARRQRAVSRRSEVR